MFTRPTLLREVWGYDFYGGTRTVDVHVRRLRAKLGPEHEHLIEPASHRLLCACGACAILFSGNVHARRYRRVPRRIEVLREFH